MAEQRDNALLLRAIPYSDSSLILHCFTQHHGRISLMSRGARRAKNLFRASLMPMYQLQIRWKEPRTGSMGTLLEVQRLTPLLPEKLMLAGQSLIARASSLFPDGVEQGFDELQHAFKTLAERDETSGLTAAIWGMLEQGGWVGDFEHCWHCSEKIDFSESMAWYQAHLLCLDCAQNRGIKLVAGCRKSLFGHLNQPMIKPSVEHIKVWNNMIEAVLSSHQISKR
ncbi:MAG TPA: DNA repair protein RecO [Ghiorsea sp.]|nr:DNA repair protein RecO [Ghiorsea sp.]